VSLFRYRAVALSPSGGSGSGSLSTGELSGESAAEVRARLRAGGLQVLDLAPVRRLVLPKFSLFDDVGRVVESHLRSRRHSIKEEACDGLATLLEAGVPLTEALDTTIRGEASRHAALRRMLVQVRDRVAAGTMLAEALREHRSWFDPVEVALLEAGEHGGSLAGALRSLASRQAKRSLVGQKVASALVYPSVVATVGVGVWVFLSTKTLPELVKILADAKVEVPALTRAVMASGSFVAQHAIAILATVVFIAIVGSSVVSRPGRERHSERGSGRFARTLRNIGPSALRRLRLGRLAASLSELLVSGVPLVEGLRAVAPTAGGRSLRAAVLASATSIEQGRSWSQTLDDGALFPAEFRRLVETGETSGELAPLLERLGQRMERSAERRIARLASLLEPAAILTLACLIGLVVAAAVLPITRLQAIV
jgi:general secretion pathway protein F